MGEFRLPGDAPSGTDTVTVKCPPRVQLTATYRISDRPSGAVDAGFGGAAAQRTQLAVGGLLLAGAVAGGVVRARRRSAASGTPA